jgi:putative flippase GtrA
MSKVLDRPHGKAGVAKRGFHLSKRLLRESAKLEPTHDYSVQFIRSAVVSVIAVVVNFGGSYIFKEKLGWYYLLSATLSFFLGVLVNYYLSVKWVFAHRQLQSKHAEFFIFVVITTVGLVKTDYWTALVVATVIVFFWNFLARKKVLY